MYTATTNVLKKRKGGELEQRASKIRLTIILIGESSAGIVYQLYVTYSPTKQIMLCTIPNVCTQHAHCQISLDAAVPIDLICSG